jgi:hypothetical protein
LSQVAQDLRERSRHQRPAHLGSPPGERAERLAEALDDGPAFRIVLERHGSLGPQRRSDRQYPEASFWEMATASRARSSLFGRSRIMQRSTASKPRAYARL